VATHNVTNHITRAVDYVEEDPTGNVYHVSITKGSNNGNGSQANPFLTINQASNVLTAGDTLYIHEGI